MHKTMKTLAIIGAIVLGLGLILCAGAIASADGGIRDGLNWLTIPARWTRGSDGHYHFQTASDPAYARETLTYTASGPVSELRLSAASHDIRLVPSESPSAVRVTYDQTRDNQFTITEENGRLTFRETAGSVNIGFNFSVDLEENVILVEYPAAQPFRRLDVSSVSGDVRSEVPAAGEVSVSTTSGDLYTAALEADSFSASSISGEMRLGAVRAGTIELASTSGDLRWEALDADTVRISSISGRLEGAVLGGKLTVGTTSGDIALNADVAETSINTTSGEVELKLASAAYRTDISTVSGDARIGSTNYDDDDLPFEGHFTLEANGNVTSGIPDGARMLKISTTSGDVTLKIN